MASEQQEVTRLAFIGDLHYCIDRPRDLVAGSATGDDGPRYEWMRENVLPVLLAEIKSCAPDLVIGTGDITECGSIDEASKRCEMTEALAIFADADLKLVSVLGNHDSREAFKEITIPYMRERTGFDIQDTYFAIPLPHGLMLFVDYEILAEDSIQQKWLLDRIADNPAGLPIVIVSHEPYVNIARPLFFCEAAMRALQPIVATAQPVLFLCGHTHNQAFTYHRCNKNGLTQIMASSLGFPAVEPAELTDRHPLLFPKTDKYYWGVSEDEAPGFWLLSFGDKQITGEWHVLGRGVMGAFTMSNLAQPPVITQQPKFRKVHFDKSLLALVETAKLHVFVTAQNNDFAININGVPVGSPPHNPCHAARRFIQLNKGALASITEKNTITIETTRQDWIVSSVSIELKLFTGETVRTKPVQQVFVNGSFAERGKGDLYTSASGRIQFELVF